MEGAAENLQTLYAGLDDLRADFRNKNLYEFVSRRLFGRRVLDVGCGVGHFLRVAAAKGFQAEGVEPDKQLIQLGGKLYGNSLPIAHLPAEAVDSLGGPFDSVTLIDVLEHIEDDGDILKKVRRILGPDGRVIILVPAYPFLYGLRDRQIGHFRRYSAQALAFKLNESGYRVIESRYWNLVGVLPYLVYEKVLRKPINTSLRSRGRKGIVSRLIRGLLDFWLKRVENNVSFGAGLSLLCVAVPDGRSASHFPAAGTSAKAA